LDEVDLSLWLALDRLDEAFAGRPKAEIPALRALFRTFLDLVPYTRVRLKLFVRKDLFRRIIAGGFVNLTHVNARKVEIDWDEESLAFLLYRRILENTGFLKAVDAASPSENISLESAISSQVEEEGRVFKVLFPDQVDPGGRKPKTWTWMMGRIRDGNSVRPPRNLIDLVQKAQQAQIRREERERNEVIEGRALISSEAMKAGLRALSKERVEDTLLAEAGSYAEIIELFRNGKAEHNLASLTELLDQQPTLIGLPSIKPSDMIQILRDIGFLEAVGMNYKVPMLYRDGLGITQGKAFDSSDSDWDKAE